MSYSPWDTSGPSQIAAAGNFYLPGVITKEKRATPKQAKTIDLKALKAYRDQRHTYLQCAEHFNSSVHVVTRLLKGHHVKRGLRIQVDTEKALQLRSDGWATAAIARELKVSERTLYERIGGSKIAKRPNAGKPRQLRMSDEQYATYQQLGGGKWLRAFLDKRAGGSCQFMEMADNRLSTGCKAASHSFSVAVSGE